MRERERIERQERRGDRMNFHWDCHHFGTGGNFTFHPGKGIERDTAITIRGRGESR